MFPAVKKETSFQELFRGHFQERDRMERAKQQKINDDAMWLALSTAKGPITNTARAKRNQEALQKAMKQKQGLQMEQHMQNYRLSVKAYQQKQKEEENAEILRKRQQVQRKDTVRVRADSDRRTAKDKVNWEESARVHNNVLRKASIFMNEVNRADNAFKRSWSDKLSQCQSKPDLKPIYYTGKHKIIVDPFKGKIWNG